MGNLEKKRLIEYQPLIGEFAWHSITVDPNIKKVSEEHLSLVLDVLKKYRPKGKISSLRILEVASYAHTTGYSLAKLGAKVTLFDISAKNLELGRALAGELAKSTDARLVAGDFHDLPLNDGSFDFVYICSSLHHTLRWRMVLDQMFRILAPGGIMFIENEPCQREACFYGFRTNRESSFTPFEKELSTLGVLRTFAEPYLGSRPETLFGMVENQQIPLGDLIATMERSAEILDLQVNPEICMGEIEHHWLEMRKKGISPIYKCIRDTLIKTREKALKTYSDIDQGLGFKLPGEKEILIFAKRVASIIKELPENVQQSGIEIAKLFGGSVRAVLQKGPANGTVDRSTESKHPPFNRKCPIHNGVYYSFGPHLRKILIQYSSVLPDIQSDEPDVLATAFPSKHWLYITQPNEVKALFLNTNAGIVLTHAKGRDVLIVLRFHVSVSVSESYRVAIRCHNETLFSLDVWQDDSILFSDIIESSGENEIHLHVEITPLKCLSTNGTIGTVLIAYAAAFRL